MCVGIAYGVYGSHLIHFVYFVRLFRCRFYFVSFENKSFSRIHIFVWPWLLFVGYIISIYLNSMRSKYTYPRILCIVLYIAAVQSMECGEWLHFIALFICFSFFSSSLLCCLSIRIFIYINDFRMKNERTPQPLEWNELKTNHT